MVGVAACSRQSGSGWVDGQSIQDFEAQLAGNLYKLWNRLCSGRYLPPPVRRVDIPKANGGTRPLGIPTVGDRVAQEVVRRYLETLMEPRFHPDSYGYRPGRSAIDAIRVARQRCWRHDWVLDIDIKGFFDNIDHELLLKAVRKHTERRWALLYIERWLKAPAMLEDESLVQRERGTPQGGVISPLLANLFLHYAFNVWLKRGFPGVPFERYAGDIICHCRSEQQAMRLREVLERRFLECGLELHAEKTKIVYCKDTSRTGSSSVQQFDFLGYCFRPRKAKWPNGSYGTSFLPAASPKALKAIRKAVRGWGLQRRSDKGLDDLARMFNPYIRGWINYYSQFYKSALYPTLQRIDAALAQWARRKFKRLRQKPEGAKDWISRLAHVNLGLFAHWSFLYGRGSTLGAVRAERFTYGSGRAWGCNSPALLTFRRQPVGDRQQRRRTSVARRRPRPQNFLFAGSDSGGERAAAICSLLGSAKLNGLDPELYLHHVLKRIANRSSPRSTS